VLDFVWSVFFCRIFDFCVWVIGGCGVLVLGFLVVRWLGGVSFLSVFVFVVIYVYYEWLFCVV